MLKQNLDFVAVTVIVAVLGIVQAPRLGVRVARVAMEQHDMQMRNVRFEDRTVPLPPMPPMLRDKVLNYR